MSNIKNFAEPGDEIVEAVRGAIEFRATWMALIFDEMRKAGVDAEGIIRKAITRCGEEIDGPKVQKLAESSGVAVDGNVIHDFSFRELMRRCFCMNPVTCDADNADATLNYCPLVHAWQKMGFSDEDIALLCDMTMNGDRGVAKANGFKLDLPCTIGGGDDTCNIHFYRGELKRK